MLLLFFFTSMPSECRLLCHKVISNKDCLSLNAVNNLLTYNLSSMPQTLCLMISVHFESQRAFLSHGRSCQYGQAGEQWVFVFNTSSQSPDYAQRYRPADENMPGTCRINAHTSTFLLNLSLVALAASHTCCAALAARSCLIPSGLFVNRAYIRAYVRGSNEALNSSPRPEAILLQTTIVQWCTRRLDALGIGGQAAVLKFHFLTDIFWLFEKCTWVWTPSLLACSLENADNCEWSLNKV